jgi:Ni,Fe-hydrogenase III small subunit/NAD-dependent dihydropyrimidine dehydrogenase PreA subunit
MVNVLRARLQQGYRTVRFPDSSIHLPERFRGRPEIDQSRCPQGCQACVDACPTQAVSFAPAPLVAQDLSSLSLSERAQTSPARKDGRRFNLDLGRCIFCTECVESCPEKAISHTPEYRMATRTREDLVLTGEELQLAGALDLKMRKLFGRSLKLRQVSASGCNGCEVEANATGNIVFDASRFGIQFVASPRHADGILVTGPVSRNMELALRKTYDAVPPPKIVIACGACAISGGPFRDHPEVLNGCGGIVPVDLYIPGSPPHPLTVLDGLLRLMGRIEDRARKSG